MRIFLVAVLMLIGLSVSSAQNITGQVTDSVGTATTFWQKVDLFTISAKGVDVINDGAVNLSFALTATDTAASKTRYQRQIKPGEMLKTYSNQRYVYIKAASSTCAYRIGTY